MGLLHDTAFRQLFAQTILAWVQSSLPESIAIDKDFKVYADRILDTKTIVEVFEPDPAEDE